MDHNTIAKQFAQFYYVTFDSDRSTLASLYRDHSMLSWEGAAFLGVKSIIEKLTSLQFQKTVHKVVTVDAQPSSPTVASLVVLVTGALIIDDGSPLQFTQLFQLIPDGGSFYVLNDVFRLVFSSGE